MSEPKQKILAIVTEGGIVQGVVTNNPELLAILTDATVLVIDYDTEGYAIDDLSVVQQGDGTKALAGVSECEATMAAIDLPSIRPARPEDEE